ncbi:MAG: hypothetical protein NT157_01140 [Candidatus Micrarchaeota archaeon]|nr:hypothetical protein [Candidatus Micrarchaeota archaeon]
MGKVVALFKVFPEDMKYFDMIKEEITKKHNPSHIDSEPVAFGFNVMKVTFLREDSGGGAAEFDRLEQEIAKIKGVSSVEIADMGRL